MIQSVNPSRTSVVFLEVNEAERHFLEKLVGAGKLPAFARVLEEGAIVNTRIPDWDAKKEKSWRDISPWIIWPSVYTGLAPDKHGIVGFGQDTSKLRERCVWDVLDRAGIPIGIFGCLMSYPPRSTGAASFYVPESLADEAECFPRSARPVQEFNVYAARNYSEGFGLKGAKALGLLLRATSAGVSLGTVARTVAQIPAEKLLGPHREPERAMLHSYLSFEVFEKLYRKYRPAYTAVHLNHTAYMQHRYWRAAEPQRFRDELSETDQRFFGSVDERRSYERKFAHWIETSFAFSDRALARMIEAVPDGGWILFGTGLGVRPFDPCGEIHNPVVRLVRERELFDALGLTDYTVLHQMNPDVTVNLASEAAAAGALEQIRALEVLPGEPLFTAQQRGRQLFLELNMPRRSRANGAPLSIRSPLVPGFRADFARHISEHWNNDQSTAHHKDAGLLIAWRKGQRVTTPHTSISVTDIAPAILSLFGIAPQPWHRPEKLPVFQSKA
jgi:hypothetical protein